MTDGADDTREAALTSGAWLRDAWLAAIADRLGPLPAPVQAAADQLAVAGLAAPDRRTQALIRFASALGAAGWDLRIVSGLVQQLTDLLEHDERHAPELTGFDAGAVAGRGWAHGYLPVVVGESTTDPLTGLATLGVLMWRLHQAYDQCAALGVEPALVYGLVVVDVVRVGSVLERDVARAAAAELLRRRFRSGETLVSAGNRLLVLTSRTPTLDDEVAAFGAESGGHPALADAGVLTWVEPLPLHADEIERFLMDVV